MSALRILVADDHELTRRGVQVCLESRPEWKVVGEAVNGREALEKAKALEPDVVILDIAMPELSGLEATRQILKAIPKTEVLILTMHESEKLVRRALEAGARAFVTKSDVARHLGGEEQQGGRLDPTDERLHGRDPSEPDPAQAEPPLDERARPLRRAQPAAQALTPPRG